MKKRRKYDRKFKQMVVELSHTRDDLSVLAKELDIRADLSLETGSFGKFGCQLPWPWCKQGKEIH